MKSLPRSIAALAGLICLTSGCAGESIDAGADDAPALSPLDIGTGHTGSNGIPPADYHPRRYAIDTLFQLPLTVNGALNPDSRFTNFIGTPEGSLVFGHAVGCALPPDKSAGQFAGEGFMSTTSSWLSGPLAAQARSDLHTCLVARLNPFGVEVPIWVGGPDTHKDAGDGAYPYFEAVWSVSVSTGTRSSPPTTSYLIWPADTYQVHTDCKLEGEITHDLNTRICDNNATLCNITPRWDMATACTGTPGGGNWVCLGKPAFETRVTQSDWNTLHPGCHILY